MIDKWKRPQEVSDRLLAYPFKVIDTLLPKRDDIPKWYFNENRPSYKFAKFASKSPLPIESRAVIRDGIYAKTAIRHLFVCLRSGEPELDHKYAGVAYLAERWFTEILTPHMNYVFSYDRKDTHTIRIPEF